MSQSFQTVRGMRDILPEDSARLTLVEDTFRKILSRYSYEEIRLPIVESKNLFDRGLGESTDAVSKEMYSFHDVDSSELALRPEGTASCARAIVNHSMAHEHKPRLWYAGPMFRHERPQAGRYRQFQQVGAEAFGYSGPAIDFELIHIVTDVLESLGLLDSTTLLINNIGDAAARTRFRGALVEYLKPFVSDLDSDSRKRLSSNPIRILDSKDEKTRSILEAAPRLKEYVCHQSTERFESILTMLDDAHISYEVADQLVRGFDYYTDSVFEWVTDKIGAQDAVCAGGRYDGLIELLGGKPTPGIGFAAGVDRIALLQSETQEEVEYQSTDVYLIALSEDQRSYVAEIARRIRQGTNLRVREHTEPGRMGAKMRWADKSGATWAVIAGESEESELNVSIKWLRSDREQVQVPLVGMLEVLKVA